MTVQSDHPHPEAGLPYRRMALLAAFVAASVAGIFTLGNVLSFDTLAANRETLITWRDSNYALVAIVYLVIYVLAVAFSLPGALFLTLAGGFLFGAIAGGVLTVFAATLGAVAIFLAARYGLGDYLSARMDASGGKIQAIRDGLRQDEISYLFLMRLVPAVPFFLANLLPALVGAKLRNYVITTFLGIMPGTFVYSWVGSGLGTVFDAGETPNLGIFFEWHILGPVLGLAALSALPILIRKLRAD